MLLIAISRERVRLREAVILLVLPPKAKIHLLQHPHVYILQALEHEENPSCPFLSMLKLPFINQIAYFGALRWLCNAGTGTTGTPTTTTPTTGTPSTLTPTTPTGTGTGTGTGSTTTGNPNVFGISPTSSTGTSITDPSKGVVHLKDTCMLLLSFVLTFLVVLMV
ncbi:PLASMODESMATA CALLOSE-BINDING PROTEIN 4 isoform X2 [Vigna angularis]|uniref:PLASMODESMATA CALLOSE-BINDING PROTEIN 4 isoform X2 n=1 Tax=Phaseolus angularis TaxID=3914 RepID=UPI0022B35E79|nr:PLASMODESMATA CALLOSE-BINDING PROTEIN 4 isoform X2 [Vigna angularis]